MVSEKLYDHRLLMICLLLSFIRVCFRLDLRSHVYIVDIEDIVNISSLIRASWLPIVPAIKWSFPLSVVFIFRRSVTGSFIYHSIHPSIHPLPIHSFTHFICALPKHLYQVTPGEKAYLPCFSWKLSDPILLGFSA